MCAAARKRSQITRVASATVATVLRGVTNCPISESRAFRWTSVLRSSDHGPQTVNDWATDR